MKNKALIFALALPLIAATGCVSQKKYDVLQQQYADSQTALAESRSDAKSLQGLLDQARRNNAELKEQYAALQRTLDQSILTN
ncbi:MAG: hypothetical protein K2L75_05715, partial [Muribaculaceae bacterium]|nr:hypothetical protein [Muribaculaceae bacterium]